MVGRGNAWLTTMVGLSNGIYFAAFMGVVQTNFALGLQWPGFAWVAIWLAAGVVWAWVSRWLFSLVFHRIVGLEKSKAQRISVVSDLPFLMMGLGPCFYSFMIRLGTSLHMTMLGKMYLPGQAEYYQLPPSGYLYLFWMGLWFTLAIILKFILGAQAYLQQAEKSRQPWRIRWGALVLAGWCFSGLLAAWSATLYPPTGDEPHYLMMSQSLLKNGGIDLRNIMEQKEYRKYYPAEHLDFHGESRPDGTMISKHFPLLPVLLVPAFAIQGRMGAVYMMCLFSSLLAAMIFLISRRLGLSEREAFLTWMLVLLCAPLGIYYDLILTEIPASLLMCVGVLGWLAGGSLGLWLLTAAIAIMPFFYPKYIPVALVLAGAGFYLPRVERKQLIMAGVALAVAGLVFVVFYLKYYGFGLAKNPYGIFSWPWSFLGVRNALGLLVDRDFGIFSTTPVFLLALVGWWWLAKEQPRVGRLVAGVFFAQYLLFVVFDDFSGSGANFSRQMIMAVVLLFPGVVKGWKCFVAKGVWGRRAAFLFVGFSILTVWICAAWPVVRYLAPKQKLWAKLGFVPSVFPSLIVNPNILDLVWALAWVIALLLLLRWVLPEIDVSLRRLAGRLRQGSRR